MFQNISNDELLIIQGGNSKAPWIVRLVGFVGECASSAVTGFVESVQEMIETCYEAGYELGTYLSK